MKKFDDNRSLNPVQSDLHNKELDTPRSAANLSCTRYFKANVGGILPIKNIFTLPNSDYEIQISNLVKLALPMARQFYGSFRVYTHVYYQEDHCLWEGSDAHYTNGRSGLLDIKKPTLNTVVASGTSALQTSVMNSPLDYLCLPFRVIHGGDDYLKNTSPYLSGSGGTDINPSVTGQISALPFVMYHNICRDYYSPQNLVQDNKLLFPDNPNDMILPYDSNGKSVAFMIRKSESYSKTSLNAVSDFSYFSGYPENKEGHVGEAWSDILLNVLRYRSWKGDYFTTASPFPNLLRGNIPDITLASTQNSIDWSDVVGNGTLGLDPSGNAVSVTSDSDGHSWLTGSVSGSPNYNATQNLVSALSKAKVNSILNASINLNQLRELEAITIFRERMARTSGEYNEMIKSQGLGNPKHEHNKPQYCGGSYQDLVFSDVTNMTSSDSAPLGIRSSQAMSSASGDVIRVHSKDYGNIMICISVVPDTVYSQGIDRCWTKLNNADEYFPILQNLAPQPVLNKEIMFQNNSSDNELFGFQERFSEYKSQRNAASGAFTLPSFEGRKSVAQRRFSTLPTLSPSFLSLSSFDYSIFANSLEMPFDFITNISCRAVQPISYTTVPGGLQARG